jgi:hypothetical protein
MKLLYFLLLAVAANAQEGCLSINPAEVALSDAGGVGEVTLEAKDLTCKWSEPSSKLEWVAVSLVPVGTTGATRVLHYAAQPNLGPKKRSGDIELGKQKITLTQEAGPRPGIAAGPSRFDFTAKLKAAEPPEKRTLRAGSDDPELVFSASPGDKEKAWLFVKKKADRAFEVSVNPKDLKPGEYSGEIRIEAPGARNSPLAIPVSLKVEP